ncbi:GNAT family N-acetyltransferase [Tamlana fucoidanivorans]|uniref:GNAT family N-acetyltransferase n=1 Tax=Allotamlana fucoidanivorans TaxID=2583814 RepID=A0A5C4SRM1_9FLAO|nr:GNAT family N-acetyltransferase [Tamlana fucoidanivorans]TNJ47074.1 GNAT family N-acetyltransferase [Tamlana fucoidanivorans]
MKTFQIYRSTRDLPKTWDTLVKHDVFLQSYYLEALVQGGPSNIKIYFVGIFSDDELVGVAIIQIVNLYLKDMFRKAEVSCAKEFFRSIISKILKGNVLVVGNLTHTGQHSMFFNKKKITLTEYAETIYKAVTALKNDFYREHRKPIHAILLKDFFVNEMKLKKTPVFDSFNFHEVSVQPNMILETRKQWSNMQDYVSDLSKKYRDRYKRARKKLGDIYCKELDLHAVQLNAVVLHTLYLNVSSNAKFNSFILPQDHFFVLKQKLNDNFKVFGYYLNHKLVGFFTLILNSRQLETYFLGYDTKHQYGNQLYLNMLYDMLDFGITQRFTSVIYARTAMAIKSSVGAKPRPMVMYMKHTNGTLNRILKPVFKLMNPKQDWEERHPFK